MTTWQEVFWLVVFVFVLAVDVAGLTVDLYLHLHGIRTVSNVASKCWPVATVIIGWQMMLPVSIALHFRHYTGA